MAEVVEQEHKSSGIAKAGLVTGIVGATGAVANALSGNGILGGLLGGGSKSQERIDALRDENIMLKSELNTNTQVSAINQKIAVLEERQNAMRTEFGQALQLEATHRANGDNSLRQYVDDNFLKAGKYLDAKQITPPVGLWPFGGPSFASYVTSIPAPGFPPPVPPTVSQSNGTTSSTTTNG